MELLGALSNQETGLLLVRIAEAVDGLGSLIIAKHDVLLIAPRPFQGQILKAMSEILIEAPEGLRAIDVWRAVERLLDRQVSKSTVKGMLAGNPKFVRVRRGFYQLRDGVRL